MRYEGRLDGRFFLGLTLALVPPLVLILAVLGSILAGVATVNQAGAIGAMGALIMGGYSLAPAGAAHSCPRSSRSPPSPGCWSC